MIELKEKDYIKEMQRYFADLAKNFPSFAEYAKSRSIKKLREGMVRAKSLLNTYISDANHHLSFRKGKTYKKE